MDRLAFLRALPYLRQVSSNWPPQLVTQGGRPDDSTSSEDNVSVLFSENTVVSVEPVLLSPTARRSPNTAADVSSSSAGPALFRPSGEAVDPNNNSSDTGFCDPGLCSIDAALVTAVIDPSQQHQYQQSSAHTMVSHLPQRMPNESKQSRAVTSPGVSSASTALSLSQSQSPGPKMPRMNGPKTSTTMPTSCQPATPLVTKKHSIENRQSALLLRFSRQHVFLVHHSHIVKMRVEEGGPTLFQQENSLREEGSESQGRIGSHASTSSNRNPQRMTRSVPHSLVIEFPSCCFRMFLNNDSVASEQVSDDDSRKELTDLQRTLEELKTRLLEQNVMDANVLGYDFLDFASNRQEYGTDGSSSTDPPSSHEPGQCEERASPMMDETTKTNGNANANGDDQKTGNMTGSRSSGATNCTDQGSSDTFILSRATKRRRLLCDKSWKAVESLHTFLNSSAPETHFFSGMNKNNYEEVDRFVSNILTSCAEDLSGSYSSAEEVAAESHKIEAHILRMEQELDHVMTQLFPSSRNKSGRHGRGETATITTSLSVQELRESADQLVTRHQQAIRARHSLSLLPHR